MPRVFGSNVDINEADLDGGPSAVCTSVCTPVDEATVQAAIDRLTSALATVDDDAIVELVAERRALREELSALHDYGAGVANLEDERARRAPKR